MAKLALVTGGTRGIGAAICKALQKEKYLVVTTYLHNSELANKFKKETGIEIFKWDVANYDECISGVEKIQKKLKKHIDILVNNAGITRDSMLHKSRFQDWQEVINTNLTSCYNMCYAVIGKMRDNNFGRIVNISSINGLKGQLGQTNYAAAKAGMIGFTKSLALESAIKNITVNAIAPGYTNTDMVAKIDAKILESIKQQIPTRKLIEPKEIARVVVFLASEKANSITGETISINGGQYM